MKFLDALYNFLKSSQVLLVSRKRHNLPVGDRILLATNCQIIATSSDSSSSESELENWAIFDDVDGFCDFPRAWKLIVWLKIDYFSEKIRKIGETRAKIEKKPRKIKYQTVYSSIRVETRRMKFRYAAIGYGRFLGFQKSVFYYFSCFLLKKRLNESKI